MIILHIVDHHFRYNGMVHAAVDLACAQAQQGHQVAFCSGEGSFAQLLEQHGVRFFDIGRMRGAKGALAGFSNLMRAIDAVRPDVVHAHMVKSAVIAFAVCRLRGLPLVTCVQNSFSKYAGLMKIGDRVITGCKVVADEMATRGVSRRKLRPILNGTIGSARQAPSDGDAKLTVDFKSPSVVTFCGMHWRKGVPDLIEGVQIARRTQPDIHLYLFGEGPDKQAFQKLVTPENAANITFCDPVPNAKPYLQKADAFVLVSIADPAPLIIAEAREAGCAVIGTRVDGIPELLEGGRAGILVEPKSPQQVADKLLYLFSDPAHLQTWRDNSQIAIDRLTVERVAQQTVDVYREVARQRKAGERSLRKAPA